MGGGKGGKAGGTFEIVGDANKPVTTDMAMDVDMSTTIGGGERPVRMETVTETRMGGTDRPLATDMTVRTPDVMRTETTADMRTSSQLSTELAITRPIETRSDMNVDVKPLVVDLAFTANIGKIPRLCIRRPYEHHLRLTVLGVEVLALDRCGEKSTVVTDVPKAPTVVWGGTSDGPAAGRTPRVTIVEPHGHGGHPGGGHEDDHDDHHGQRHEGSHAPYVVPSDAGPGGPGLRIRLGP
jgi:hypothetical protein